MRTILLALIFAGLAGVAPTLADGAPPSNCIDAAIPKDTIVAHGGRWIELTAEQRLFLAGVYVIWPKTPPGLPYGDKAVLAQMEGDKGGLIFWIDGDKACAPLPVPGELLDMMRAITGGEVNHEGGGL